jgi:small subunit ribosomal protein S2
MIDFRDLVKAGVHFGHQTSRWCPKMAPFIWGEKNNVHLIDVSKTAAQLEKAAKFLEDVAAEGKMILWIGTKKPAQNIVTEAAQSLNMPFVSHRWIGGTLSNFYQVKKSITKLLHLEDVIAKAEKTSTFYTKKELGVINKQIDRLKKNVGGIRNLTWPVGAIVLVDVRKEQAGLKEANSVGVPVVALVDTNGDPSNVDFVIPGNDDAPRAIKVVVDYLKEAAQKGKEVAATKADKPVQGAAFQAQKDVSMAEALLNLEEEDGKGGKSKSRPRPAARRTSGHSSGPSSSKKI